MLGPSGQQPPGNYGFGGGYGYGQVGQQPPPQQGGYPQDNNQYGQPPNNQYGQPPPYPPRQMPTTTSMNLVFFVAACSVMLGAFIGGTLLLFSWELVDFLEMTYLLAFGAILAVLDTPFFKAIKIISDMKMYVGKYVALLTRVTGKGLAFIFLGSSLFTGMWDNLEGGFQLFLSVVLCLGPAVVGLAALVIGILKSKKLNMAKRKLDPNTLDQRYDQWARTYPGPQGGLTQQEFNGLTAEAGADTWEDADLKLIFNALVSNPTQRMTAPSSTGGETEAKIPREDLKTWVSSGVVWL